MKNFSKLLIIALVVALVASIFAISTAAASTDPHDLKPGSDQVIFIMDAPEGQDLPGDGTGRDANNPLKPIDHERFDPEADPSVIRNDYQTAWYQATEILRDTGGTIVICGPVTLGPDDTYGTVAQTTRDVYTARYTTHTIKFTSVYNGVDYRTTNNARLTVEFPAELCMNGQSIWENIDIETIGTDRVISCNDWPTLFGEGIKCYPQEPLYAGVANYYISVSGGHRYEGGLGKTPTLVVQSGTYNVITAAIWGVTNQRKFNEDGSVNWTYNNDGDTMAKLVLEGTTTVKGQISGTSRKMSEFAGVTDVTINGGTYECDVFGIGVTGVTTKNGVATIRINGGDFSKAWSISPIAPGYSNNPPAAGLLDLSGWQGDKAGLAAVYKLASESENAFMTIQLPEGVTADELNSIQASTSGVAAETQAPAGDSAETKAPASNEPTVDGDGFLIIGDDEATETQAVVGADGGNGGANLGLIIGITVGVVGILGGALAVIIVLKKNKKS